jgi:hypothetical protein
MTSMHCAYFFASEWASELRGAALWRAHQNRAKWFSRKQWLKSRFAGDEDQHPIVVGMNGRIPIPAQCSLETLFLCMPHHELHLEVLRDRHLHRTRVIVDIVGDVLLALDPADMGPDMKAAGETTEQSSWEWWFDPGRQNNLRECLNLATVITTSFAELIRPLREATDYQIPVIHLPDMHPTVKSELAFLKNMMTVMEVADGELKRSS